MKTKKKLYAAGIIFILIFASLTANIVMAEPGGDDDPIISLSYIQNTVIPELKAYVDAKIASITSNTGNQNSGSTAEAPSFKVVEITQGQKLIADAGTELILRMGKATIIATEKGGIADVTAGFDLANNSNMPSNHHLIVPVGDGRGLVAQDDIIVMVKGGYSVK